MMIIIPIGPFERIVNLSIEALEGQVDILNALGYSSQRPDFIERLRAQAISLSDLIEKTEETFIESIENFSNEVIDQTAEARDGFIKVSKKTDDPELQEIAGLVSEAHNNTVKFLGKEEDQAISQVRESTTVMKGRVQKLLQQIGNLRVR